ncbi:MAG: class I SAM-dependent methyltransferase [Elusimicrobia bacterium]|nr:class I SAM-dependent methyltransferase [Elusimicrobiota bacterium]
MTRPATEVVEARHRRWFPAFVPAHEHYISRAREFSRPGDEILHLGAGRDALGMGAALPGRKLISVDCDEKGLELNPNQTKLLADGAKIPLHDGAVDLVLCEHVFEHLERPLEVLGEAARVLKPGGRLLFMTPNRFGYVAVIASLTPFWFHVRYKSLMVPTAEIDTFPTYYRLNTRRTIARLGGMAGFSLTEFRTFVGWPTYFEHSDPLHRIGLGLNWLLERGPSTFHLSLYGALTKRA